MTLLCHALLGFLWLCAQAPAPDSKPTYTQTYRIFIKGQPAGKETVTERIDKGGNLVVSSEHDILVTDGLETKRMAFATTTWLAKGTLAPLRYLYQYTSGPTGDSLEVTFRDGQATRVLNRGVRNSVVPTPFQSGSVLLDFNVYHHYDLLSRKYDFRKGGRQTFSHYIPVIGNDITMALTRLEDSNLEYPGGSMPVWNFRIEMVGISSGVFSTDRGGRLLWLLIPVQDLEVIREELLPK